ncbi:hypothetical protein [uncultured Albimonas sp.]|uniref:hypothetical protein n=1 Tax=uncultured Albimonas sp. TaxID=1331701 RepID=UPI0030EB2C93
MPRPAVEKTVAGGSIRREADDGRVVSVRTEKGVETAAPRSEEAVRAASVRRQEALRRLADR